MRNHAPLLTSLAAAVAAPVSGAAFAAARTASAFDGAQLSLWWGAPFAGLLLSIALVPLFSAKFWHDH